VDIVDGEDGHGDGDGVIIIAVRQLITARQLWQLDSNRLTPRKAVRGFLEIPKVKKMRFP